MYTRVTHTVCALHPQVCFWNVCRMSSTFVTLAEVLEARGGPLLEEEVWSLLLGSAEALVDVTYKGNIHRQPLFSACSCTCVGALILFLVQSM